MLIRIIVETIRRDMENIPSVIYLQIEEAEFINEATWCSEQINVSDVAYQRVSDRKGYSDPISLLATSVAEGGDDATEQLAAYAHEAWSGWMEYLFSKCDNVDGGMLIPQSLVERWKRQSTTKYGALPEGEKASDRKEASVMLEILSRR